MSFSFTQLIPGVGPEYAHVATAGLVTVGLIGAAAVANKTLGKGEAAAIPADSFSIKGLFELVTEFIGGLVDMVIGHGGRKYLPMFCAFFTFVLVNNFVGVLPGMSPATENLNLTLAMGLFILIRESGFYLKTFILIEKIIF